MSLSQPPQLHMLPTNSAVYFFDTENSSRTRYLDFQFYPLSLVYSFGNQVSHLVYEAMLGSECVRVSSSYISRRKFFENSARSDCEACLGPSRGCRVSERCTRLYVISYRPDAILQCSLLLRTRLSVLNQHFMVLAVGEGRRNRIVSNP